MRIIAFQYKADTADVCKHVVYTSRRHKATYLSIRESCFWPPQVMGPCSIFTLNPKCSNTFALQFGAGTVAY